MASRLAASLNHSGASLRPARRRRAHSSRCQTRAAAGPHPWSRIQAMAPAARAASYSPRGDPRSPNTGPSAARAMVGAHPWR
eukprot:6692454-Alexandrium_andersonii.AAC.1